MSEKWPTVIFIVDLECKRCNSKIRKAICKLQDRCKIRTVAYDEKKKAVTISGPFDPNEVIKKICCKACEVIKDIQIVQKKPEEKKLDPPPPEEKKLDPPPPEEKKFDPPPPEEKKLDPPPPEEKKLDPPPPEEKKHEPEAHPQQVWGPGTGCCCRPWIEAYFGGCRCCSCGWVYYGPVCYEVPKPTYVYGGPCYGGPTVCEVVYEEPSGCRIM